MRTSANKHGERRVKVLSFLAGAHTPIEGHSVLDLRPQAEMNGAGKRIPCVFKVGQKERCEVRVGRDTSPTAGDPGASVTKE